MKNLRFAVAAAWLAALFLFAPRMQAQPLPPLEEVAEAFKRGDASGRLPTYLVGVCPATNPYGDRLMLRLMAEEQTWQLVASMAGAWRLAIRTCDDDRYDAWYRQRLLEARDWAVVRRLVDGLLQDRTPRNIAAVKAFAFDAARDEETRTNVLYELHYGWNERQKTELFMEVYRQPGTMPENYASTTQQNLIAGPEARLFAERLIETVFQYPNEPDAADLLLNLVSDVHWGMGRRQPGLREIAVQALQRAAQNPGGRLPRPFAEVARLRLAELRDQRVIP